MDFNEVLDVIESIHIKDLDLNDPSLTSMFLDSLLRFHTTICSLSCDDHKINTEVDIMNRGIQAETACDTSDEYAPTSK